MVLVTGSLLVGGSIIGAATLGTIGAGALYYKYRKMEKRRLSKQASIGLFGSLLDTIDPIYVDDKTGVPKVVELIFAQIELSGITTNGIFHATGNIENIQRIRQQFINAETDDIQLFEENTHDLCGLVLHYLQRLPEPLCTLVLYEDFLKAHRANQSDREQWIEVMKDIFKLLPELNRRLFQRVLEFFYEVGTVPENNVSHSYLAYLLGPILFYDRVEADEEDGEPVKLQYNGEIVYELLMDLFEFHEKIFPVPLSELPPWQSTRTEDSETRRNSSSHDAPIETLPEINSSGENTTVIPPTEATEAVNSPKKRKRKKREALMTSINKFTKPNHVSLPSQPPPNTMPINYVMPNINSE